MSILSPALLAVFAFVVTLLASAALGLVSDTVAHKWPFHFLIYNCRFCGREAGFLRRRHRECEAEHDSCWNEMISISEEAARTGKQIDTRSARLNSLATRGWIPVDKIRDAEILGWQKAVHVLLDTGFPSAEQESFLVKFEKQFGLTAADVNASETMTRLVQSCTLRSLSEGEIRPRITITGELQFNLQKAETLLWIFNGVQYLTEKTHRTYVGRSHGFSVKIAKGLYYRTGVYGGGPVETTALERVGIGALGITNRHIYFAGPSTSFRIPLSKIVSLTPYSDGIGLYRDRANAKREVFITRDAGFLHDLITRMPKE